MRIPFVAATLITLFPLVIVAFQSPWSILDLRSTHCFYQKFKFNQKSQVHTSYLPHNHNLPKTTRRTDSYHVQQERTRCSIAPIHMSLDASGFGSSMTTLMSSLFRTSGGVPFIEAFGVNAVLFAALSQKLFTMLTPTGFAHSLVLGTSLWATLGWKGWLYCVVYLFLGQAVTKVRFTEKQEAGLAEGRGGRRGPENVWGSAATAVLCAVFSRQVGDSILGISSQTFLLGYVASLATKLADTFASEIGKAYGKTTFLITTLERVEPGTEGAVSLEGTAASVVGGLILSLIGYLLGLIQTIPAVIISTIAAFIATNIESVLGATLQDKKGLEWMTNEVVNFINTLIGAALAMVAGVIFLMP